MLVLSSLPERVYIRIITFSSLDLNLSSVIHQITRGTLSYSSSQGFTLSLHQIRGINLLANLLLRLRHLHRHARLHQYICHHPLPPLRLTKNLLQVLPVTLVVTEVQSLIYKKCMECVRSSVWKLWTELSFCSRYYISHVRPYLNS